MTLRIDLMTQVFPVIARGPLLIERIAEIDKTLTLGEESIPSQTAAGTISIPVLVRRRRRPKEILITVSRKNLTQLVLTESPIIDGAHRGRGQIRTIVDQGVRVGDREGQYGIFGIKARLHDDRVGKRVVKSEVVLLGIIEKVSQLEAEPVGFRAKGIFRVGRSDRAPVRVIGDAYAEGIAVRLEDDIVVIFPKCPEGKAPGFSGGFFAALEGLQIFGGELRQGRCGLETHHARKSLFRVAVVLAL